MGTNLEPPATEEQVVDPKPTTGVTMMEVDGGAARSAVPRVEGGPIGTSAVEEPV